MQGKTSRQIPSLHQAFRAVLAFALILSLLFIWPANAASAEEPAEQKDSQVIKVAYYPDYKYMDVDSDGHYVGFNVDFLYEIGRFTNWTYEYVPFATPTEAYHAARAGEVDILPSIHRNPEREERFLFSDRPMAEVYVTLAVREDETRFAYEDFESLEGATVGCIVASTDAVLFQQYCEDNGLTVDIEYYNGPKRLVEALESGEVDAVATNYLGNDSSLRVAARFYPDPIYLAFPKDRTEIKEAVDNAMESLLLRDPTYYAVIYDRYFGVNPSQTPLFTAEEYEYIENAEPLRVVYEKSRMPLSQQDSEGNFTGVGASLLETVSEKTGLTFEYIGADTYLDAIQMIERGEADIIYAAHEESVRETQRPVNLTGSYLTSYLAQITGDNPQGNRIAMPIGHSIPKEIIDARPFSEISYYNTARDCLDAVANRAVDVAYVDTHVGGYCLNEPRYDGLEMVALTHISFDLALGVSKSQNPLLVYILDRAVQYTPRSEVAQWVSENMTSPHPVTFIELVRLYPLHFFLIGVVLVVIVVSVAFYIYYSRSRSRQRIDELSYGDTLTKGWNLTRFQAESEQTIMQRKDTQFAILYFDVSRFKSFNAAFGFAQGDRLLITISDQLKNFTTDEESFARITADEFVVLTVWKGWELFVERFEQFDELVNNQEILTSKGYRVLLVGGVSHIDSNRLGADGNTLSEYIDDARYARETVDETTRSTAVLYTPAMKKQDLAKQKLFNEAEAAMSNGEFIAYYQPKVEIATNRIVGLEALARWVSPTKGLRAPAEFIPVFEANGFILTLDLYIFRLACQRIRARMDAGKNVVPIGCNFSRQHLRLESFPETVKAIADEYEVPAQCLGLELTEDIVMDDYEHAKAMCVRLKNYGFTVLVDDFGKGYSSLGTLHGLPVDVLKLDQSFLKDHGANGSVNVVLEGAVQIAQGMGLSIVAEGVETQEQADMLVALDNRIVAQGYLYSRPVPLTESEAQVDKGVLYPHEE